jgi:hypothetical protein
VIDIDKLIDALNEVSALQAVQNKKIYTNEIPAQLYIRMVIASLATKKSITNCMSTALETYTMRNEEKHYSELKLQAAAAEMEVETYLAQELAKRLL